MRYDVCLAVFFLKREKRKKKETVSSFSHGSDFGDFDETKPRFRRVTLQRPPSRYSPPTACLFFRDTLSAPLIFKQYLRVLPCDPDRQRSRAAINLRVFHLFKQRFIPSRRIKVRESLSRSDISFNDAT